MNLNSVLKRVFRSYNAESNKRLSDWHKRMLAVDENYAATVAARDNANEGQKNKRAVNVVRRDRNTGKTMRYTAGVLATRDHGSPQEKLRKALGGKSMRRILKRERRLGRENPSALEVNAIGDEGNKHALARGVDFAVIPAAFGGPSLVLHDMATKFEASYESGFANELAGG